MRRQLRTVGLVSALALCAMSEGAAHGAGRFNVLPSITGNGGRRPPIFDWFDRRCRGDLRRPWGNGGISSSWPWATGCRGDLCRPWDNGGLDSSVEVTQQYDTGGYLIGASYVIDALGRYQVNRAEAEAKMQQVIQARLDNQRRRFEWWLEWRQRMPSRADELEREVKRELQYQRFQPAKTEIWSGHALNVVLESLKRGDPTQFRNAQQVIEIHVLERINLTDGRGPAHTGLLKSGGVLKWPSALRSDDLGSEGAELRYLVQFQLKRFCTDLQEGRSPVESDIRDVETCVKQLDKLLSNHVSSTGFAEYTEAKNYLRQVRSCLLALRNGSAQEYLNGRYALKNLKKHTVADVILFMRDNGLEFAPACEGDHAAYVALHRALANVEMAGATLTTVPEGK